MEEQIYILDLMLVACFIAATYLVYLIFTIRIKYTGDYGDYRYKIRVGLSHYLYKQFPNGTILKVSYADPKVHRIILDLIRERFKRIEGNSTKRFFRTLKRF